MKYLVNIRTFLFIGLSLLLSCGSEIQVSQFGEDQSVLDVRVEQLSTQADPTKSANIYFNVYFSNSIESKTFGADDIVQDGTSSGIIWDVIHVSEGKHFIVIGTGPMTNGTVKPKIPQGSISNKRGVKNTASQSIDNTVLYKASFDVSIEQSINETVGSCSFGAQSDPVTLLPIEYKVSFSEEIDVASFDASDITQSGNAKVDTWVLTNCGDDQHFKLEASVVSGYGVVQPTITAGAILNSDLDQNENSTSEDNSVTYNPVSPFIWTGAVDNNWNVPGNWKNNTVPGVSDVAVFSGVECSNCNVQTSGNVNVRGFWIDSSFPGTITQNLGDTITVGNDDFIQLGGTFLAGDSYLRLVKGIKIDGGTFTHSTGELQFQSDTIDGTIDVGMTQFNNVLFEKYNNGDMTIIGTLDINGTLNLSNNDVASDVIGNINLAGDLLSDSGAGGRGNVIRLDGTGFQNINLAGSGGFSLVFASTGTVVLGTDVVIQKDLTYISGSIVHTGSTVAFSNSGYPATIDMGATALNNVRFDKYNNKDVTVIGSLNVDGDLIMSNNDGASDIVGNFTVAGNLISEEGGGGNGGAGFHTITLDGSGTQEVTLDGVGIHSLVIASSGTVNFNSVNTINKDLTYISGAVNTAGSSIIFDGATFPAVINMGVVPLYNVQVDKYNGPDISITGTLDIDGELYLNNDGACQFNGNVTVAGDLRTANAGAGSGAVLGVTLDGAGDQNITWNASRPTGDDFIINKASGNVILQTDVNLNGSGQDLILTDGDIIQNGYNLTVADTLSMATGTTINKGCTTLTVNSASIPVGAYDSGNVIGSGSNPTISIADATVVEGGNLEFNVSLSEGVCASPTSITYTSDDGTATLGNSDYTDNDSTLIIPAGSLSGTITVITGNDSTYELDETMTVNLTGTDQGSLGTTSAIGTIENDDASSFHWSGASGDGKWSTASNWYGGVVPASSDIAIFSDSFCINCNANIDVSVGVNGVLMESNYTGTLVQNSGTDISIGTGHFYVKGGVFVGGDSLINLDSNFYLSGGSFTSTSDIFQIGKNNGCCSSNNNGFVVTGGSFIHNNGEIRLDGIGSNGTGNNVLTGTLDSSIPISFYKLNIAPIDINSAGGYDDVRVVINNANNLTVEHEFIHTSGFLKGTGNIQLKGNYVQKCLAIGNFCAGSTGTKTIDRRIDYQDNLKIEFVGTSKQTYEGEPDATSVGFLINNPTSVEPKNGTQNLGIADLTIAQGTFVAPPSQLLLYRVLLSSQDAVDGFVVGASGTFDPNNGKVIVNQGGHDSTSARKTSVFTASAGVDFYDLEFRVNEASGVQKNNDYQEVAAGSTLTVLNNLYFSDGKILGTGTIDAKGNVFISCDSGDLTGADNCFGVYKGNLKLTGSGDQEIFGNSISPGLLGTVEINKTSGQVKQYGNINLSDIGTDFTLINGVWNLNGFDLNVNDTLTIHTFGTLKTNCGSLTYGNLINNGLIEGSLENPTINITDASATEGDDLEFNVTLSEGVCSSATSITFTSDDGSATLADSDYTDNDSTLIIPAGSLSGTITVSTVGDTKVESDETVVVNLTGTDQGTIGTSSASGTISNDDLCPTGFIAVDGNSTLRTETFCVMQFEAKDDGGGTPESVPAGLPWVNIAAVDTQSRCESITEGGYTGNFSLISNPEWMTIARDIESTDTNWSGGSVGSGHIPRGHSDEVPFSPLAVLDTLDPYDGTSNNFGETPGSGWEQKRVHSLSNGSQIWDLAGNVREWVDWNGGSAGFNIGPVDVTTGWKELSVNPIGSITSLDYKPSNDSFSSSNSFGRWYGGTGGAAIRGGDYREDDGIKAGVFSLKLNWGPTGTDNLIGFRCVYREKQVPLANDFTAPNMIENIESIITLDYGEVNGDLATSCSVTGLVNVTETTGCSCDGSGVCTVGVTGLLNYTGAANFDFTITDIDGVSDSATVNVTINP